MLYPIRNIIEKYYEQQRPKDWALGNTTKNRLHIGVHIIDLNYLISVEQVIGKPG
jgi:hypothetical protein